MKDFTTQKYIQLLEAVNESKIQTYGINDWLMNNPERGILIRHDVDRKSENSLLIAEREHDYNIKSTFYFRITKGSFNIDIIKKISKLGHEIGYHYEDLSLAGGDYENAIKLFEENLQKFRELVQINTIAMHGRPFSKFDNRDLWKKFNFKDFGILSEAFLSIDYKDIYYFTDTGRSWNPNSVNLRDKVNNQLSENINSTDDLIEFIKKNKSGKIAIVSHPERWSNRFIEYYKNYIFDSLVNIAKITVKNLLR